jgi:hypothetical protein
VREMVEYSALPIAYWRMSQSITRLYQRQRGTCMCLGVCVCSVCCRKAASQHLLVGALRALRDFIISPTEHAPPP